MRITDLTVVDSDFRTYRKCITLQQTIERRLQWYRAKHPEKIRPEHTHRAGIANRTLGWLKLALASPEAGDWTPWAALAPEPREINSSLSSRELIKKSVKDTCWAIFEGLPQPTQRQYNDYEQTLVDQMKIIGINSRAAMYRSLLSYEIAEKAAKLWFMVFDTLTVTEDKYYAVFNKNSTKFKQYIRNVKKLVGGNHTYMAVIEEGTEHGRLHIHVMHFFDTLPERAEDPNKGRKTPSYRELDCFKSLWDEGWSVPKIVRYSPIDAWGMKGYRWPWDTKTNKPYKVGSPLRVSSYMSKYITKSYSSKRRSKLLWRVRKSQKLGTTVLQELLSTLELQDLLNIATNSTITTRLNNQRVPPALLRRQSLLQYLELSSHETRNSLFEMAQSIEPMPSLLTHSKGSTQDAQRSNLRNITLTRINNTDCEASFNKTERRLDGQANKINERYFKPANAYGTTSTRDHIYG